MPAQLDLAYPNVLRLFQRHIDKGRTESRAFLTWFLEHYYRLDEVAAHDAVCDGPDDKGIDGLYVDENLERIDVFQSKLFQNIATKTVGDGSLRTFIGTIDQLRTRAGVEHVVATTSNQELASLLTTEKVAELVERDFKVRGVFVTNANHDANAAAFIAGRSDLVLMDGRELESAFVPTGPSAPVATPVTFDVSGYDIIEHRTTEARAIFAPVAATDLIRLDGLSSGRLFVWNVRQSLGKTKVNKEIATSISQPQEHTNFLLYHNGLTILCESVVVEDGRLTIAGYNAVNGCQSLTSLYENRSSVSADLRILVRLVELSPESDLAGKITHHSNNQNSINARDLQSNSAIQRRLQNEFLAKFPGEVFYKIKRGEVGQAPLILENEDVAKLLLAFDVEMPWSCHQSYKLFDELHTEIFARPEVNASRILALYYTFLEVEAAAGQVANRLMGSYSLTRYFLMYLLRQALEQDELGRDFARTPEKYLSQPNGADRLRASVNHIMADLIVDLNAELADREENNNPIDYKRDLKSITAAKKLVKDIIPAYQKAVNRNRAAAFGEEWRSSEP